MVVALSYILAVIMTAAIAIILYPIAAAFWVFGLLGKFSDKLFGFTKRTIARLWKDLSNSDQVKVAVVNTEDAWTCACGCTNAGKYCSDCGASKPE